MNNKVICVNPDCGKLSNDIGYTPNRDKSRQRPICPYCCGTNTRLLDTLTNLELYILNLKRCSRCGIIKRISDFRRDSIFSDGIHVQCKSCEKAYSTKGLNKSKDKKDR